MPERYFVPLFLSKWRIDSFLDTQGELSYSPSHLKQVFITDPHILDTLAAAYAEAGRFREALAFDTQQKQLPPVESLKARIALYDAGTPSREASRPHAPPTHR